MPCRNAGAHLRELLNSLLAQTRQDFDLILVDDASTDGSPELAQAVAGDRITIHRNPEPLGIPNNWNFCSELVRTPFFCLAHQDDVYEETYLERMLVALTAQPAAALAHCQTSTIVESGQHCLGPAERFKMHFWRRLQSATLAELYSLLHAGNFIACSSVLFRTEALRAVSGFRSDLRFAPDWELWLRLLLADMPLCAVPEPLLAYRRHQAAATNAAAAGLWRYEEELQIATWARDEGIRKGWLQQKTPHARSLRNNLLEDAFKDLSNGDRAAAERKLDFLRTNAPWLWRDPVVRVFRSLRRFGAAGRLVLGIGRAAALRSGFGAGT